MHELRKTVIREHLELAFADVARRVEVGWIDQQFSPLGRRRHCQAVKRRIAARQPGDVLDAAVIGRRYMLTVDALVEEYFASRVGGNIDALKTAPVANENGGPS